MGVPPEGYGWLEARRLGQAPAPALTQPRSLPRKVSDVELRACRQPAVAGAHLLHIAERRERHVIADDRELLVRHHVEDAPAGGGTCRLVGVEEDVPVGLLDCK